MKRKQTEFLVKVSELQGRLVEEVIRLADEYGEDRNDTIDMIAFGFHMVAENVDFDGYHTNAVEWEEIQ